MFELIFILAKIFSMKFLLLLFLIPTSLYCQTNYPKDYFRSPLDIPMQLSGNFGELRNNHIHSGFDIKTNKMEGLPVFAAADGYVSRIKISNFGYGKALYITHPNGYTTVYGHLQKANNPIESYIKKNQYSENKYEIEVFPKLDELPVKKGDLIAFSGNTGGSGGPHLHFEFRDTKTEKIINPMFFGFNKEFIDTKKPSISSLILYPLGEQSIVNKSNQPVVCSLAQQKDGSYLAERVFLNGKMGFGINTFDMFDKSYSKFGVYKVALFCNGKSIFEYKFDTFSFDEFKFVNALIDYPRYVQTNQRVQQLFMQNPYPLSIISTDNDYGIVTMESPNLQKSYRIEISDFENNTTVITIPVDYSIQKPIQSEKPKHAAYFVKATLDSNFAKDNVDVFFPAGTFYYDFYLDFEVKKDTIHIHNATIPVQNSYSIAIEDTKHTESELSKVVLVKIDKKKLEYIPTRRKGTLFTVKTKELGIFTLLKDTVAPKIIPIKNIDNKWISADTKIELSVSDELSGIKEYNCYLNGKWALFEYEYKTKTLTYNFEDNVTLEGKNDLKVIVTDNVGNSTIFETSFFRSQK